MLGEAGGETDSDIHFLHSSLPFFSYAPSYHALSYPCSLTPDLLAPDPFNHFSVRCLGIFLLCSCQIFRIFTTLPILCLNRFALQLLTPASILSQLQGRTEIILEDVRETDSLFLDARSSARQLSGREGVLDGSAAAAPVGRGEYMR